jgi:hypothetical protein
MDLSGFLDSMISGMGDISGADDTSLLGIGGTDTTPFEAGYSDTPPTDTTTTTGDGGETGGPATGNPDEVTPPPGGGPSAPTPSIPGGLQKILQGLGVMNANGDINPLALMYTLGPLLGGALQYHNTGAAAQQVVAGINNASTAAQGLLGGSASPFAPYVSTGQAAMARAPGLMFPQLGASSLSGLLHHK